MRRPPPAGNAGAGQGKGGHSSRLRGGVRGKRKGELAGKLHIPCIMLTHFSAVDLFAAAANSRSDRTSAVGMRASQTKLLSLCRRKARSQLSLSHRGHSSGSAATALLPLPAFDLTPRGRRWQHINSSPHSPGTPGWSTNMPIPSNA
jgi:hypothetical protein